MDKDTILKELNFKAIRSSGAGGQHVNKVSSKVELSFDIEKSLGLSTNEKDRLKIQLQSRLTKDHILVLQCDEARSQHKNKKLVAERFLFMLKKTLSVPKKRKPTKPSKSAVEKRIKSKKKLSDKKTTRKKPDLD